MDGRCTTAIGTIRDDAFAVIATSEMSLIGSPAAASNATYWSISLDGGYVRIDSATHAERIVPVLTSGYHAESIAADGQGRAYGLELSNDRSDLGYVVDLERHTKHSFVAPGAVTPLVRQSDGHVYFRETDPETGGCHLYEIDAQGRASEAAECTAAGGLAIGRGGALWSAIELGIARSAITASAHRNFGPVLAEPCDIVDPFADLPAEIVADQRGNAWFLLGKLWHVDVNDNVTSADIPAVAIDGPDASAFDYGMMYSADGSLWIFSKSAVRRFVPAGSG